MPADAPSTGPTSGSGGSPASSLPPAAWATGAPVSQHWSVRLRDLLSTYLPLLLMLALAGATWWLVRITPLPPMSSASEPSPQAPDYTLQGVDLQRYRGDGALLARIQGRELRHFPQGDRMELEDARILLNQADGPVHAQARQAEVTDGGDRVRLMGSVVLRRPAGPQQEAFEVHGEVVEFDVRASRAWSDQAVEWVQDASRLRAAGFDYRQADGQVQLRGPVQANWLPASPKGR